MEVNRLPIFRINNDNKSPKQNIRFGVSCPNLAPLKQDTVSFKGVVFKKSDFEGVDLAVIEKFKPNIQQFKKKEDLQTFAEGKIGELKEKDFGGRQEETIVQRNAMLKEWFDYVIKENDAYSNTQRLVILSAITKDLKENNDAIPPVLNKGVLAQTVIDLEARLKENPKENFDFNKMYQNNLRTAILDNADTGETMTGWVVIPSKENDPKNFEKNVEKLKTLSHNSWCTKSFNAEPYLSQGDFHVYLENGEPKLGVRFVGDEVQEIQGERNNGKIPVKYLDTFKIHKDECQMQLTNKAREELNTAEKNKESINKAKNELGNALGLKNIEDVQKVLNYFGINAEINNNNLLVLDKYMQSKRELTLDDLDVDENKIFNFVEEIKDNVYFINSNATSLGKIKKIHGDVSFACSKIKDIGNLETIGGDANFELTQNIDLKNLKSIGGCANFKDSKITNLGKLEKIGDEALFSFSEIVDLGNLKAIGGSANFTNSKIKNLKNLENIGGCACFIDSQVENLDKLQNIGGKATFARSKITSLGQLKNIGGGAEFSGSQIEDLGELKNIGAFADFTSSKIKSLGKLEHIGRFAELTATDITDLGNLKYVGENVYIELAKLKEEDFANVKVKGRIYADRTHETFFTDKINKMKEKTKTEPAPKEQETEKPTPKPQQPKAGFWSTVANIIKKVFNWIIGLFCKN